MKSALIGSATFLVGTIVALANVAKVVLQDSVKAQGPMHWILTIDVSGSMSWALSKVQQDVIRFIAALPGTHYVSIIIFSGHNQARLIAGPTLCNAGGKKLLEAKVQSMRILSTTVFSEGLQVCVKTAEELASADIRHHAVLFTDGCPVPDKWSYGEEVKRSYDYAKACAAVGVDLSTIGYGYYYNLPFLTGMVSANGSRGVTRHIDDIETFGELLADIRKTAEATRRSNIDLKVTNPPGATGLVLRTTPQIDSVGTGGKITLRSIVDGQVTLFILLPPDVHEFTLEGEVDGEPWKQVVRATGTFTPEAAAGATLTAASWAFQTGAIAEAGALLQATGDEALANLVGNAYTDRERLSLGDQLRRILIDAGIRQRYSTRKFVGKGEAASVVNLLRVLLEEDCTVFIPKGTYTNTTVTTVETGMRHKPNAKMKMTEVQSNQKRYNLSIKCVVDVEEELPPGSGNWQDGVRFRNFVVVKDGNLWQKTLEAYLTQKAFDLCLKWGVVPEGSKFSATKLYTLDLTVLPMIIASWANPKQLGLVDLMKEEMVLAVQQTAINARVKQLRTEPTTWPKREKLESNDSYPADHYEYELKNFTPPTADFSSIKEFSVADEKAKAIRKRLLKVRFLKRLILFAMDKSGNKLFAGVPATPVARAKYGKEEQVVNLASLGEPGLSLRRVTWNEPIPITSKEDDDE